MYPGYGVPTRSMGTRGDFPETRGPQAGACEPGEGRHTVPAHRQQAGRAPSYPLKSRWFAILPLFVVSLVVVVPCDAS